MEDLITMKVEAERAYSDRSAGVIDERLNDLDQAIERLQLMVDRASTKFGPVIQEERAEPGDPPSVADSPPQSAVAARMQESSRNVNRASDRIASLIDRCDL